MRPSLPEPPAHALPTHDWPRCWGQLAQRLTPVGDRAGRARLLQRCLAVTRPITLGFVNAHAMNLAARDPVFARDLAGLDVVVRDGIGMALLLRWMGLPAGLNLNGTDLIPDLIGLCPRPAHERSGDAPLALLLLGTASPWLEQAQAALRGQGLSCQSAHGFLAVPAYLRLARQLRPRLIVLGMGMPRQEAVAQALRAGLDFPCLIVCGGAIIDFLGGRVHRAPPWVRALRSEWLWRLACEPRRLFGRYVIGNPLFIARALRLALVSRHQSAPWAKDTR